MSHKLHFDISQSLQEKTLGYQVQTEQWNYWNCGIMELLQLWNYWKYGIVELLELWKC